MQRYEMIEAVSILLLAFIVAISTFAFLNSSRICEIQQSGIVKEINCNEVQS